MAATRAEKKDPQTTAPPHDPAGEKEGFLHFLAREGQTALRIILILSIIAAAVAMATIWILVVIPLIVFAIAYVLLGVCSRIEVSTRSESDERRRIERDEADDEKAVAERERGKPAWKRHNMTPGVLWREVTLATEAFVGIGILAAIIAIAFMPRDFLFMGAIVFFAYMMFVMAPVWLGWFTQETEDAWEKSTESDQS